MAQRLSTRVEKAEIQRGRLFWYTRVTEASFMSILEAFAMDVGVSGGPMEVRFWPSLPLGGGGQYANLRYVAPSSPSYRLDFRPKPSRARLETLESKMAD